MLILPFFKAKVKYELLLTKSKNYIKVVFSEVAMKRLVELALLYLSEKDEQIRLKVERILNLWLGYFRWAERDNGKFYPNPVLIDQFIRALAEIAKSAQKENWRRFVVDFNEIEQIAARTKILRQSLLNALTGKSKEVSS